MLVTIGKNKTCTGCKNSKSFSDFTKHKTGKFGLDSLCRECKKSRSRRYRGTLVFKNKNFESRINRYGLSITQFNILMEIQDNRCAICQKLFDKSNKPVLDHDHTCCPIIPTNKQYKSVRGNKGCGKCVRGLLCNSCNVGLGMFGDNAVLLVAATHYLKKSTLDSSFFEEISLEETDLIYQIE